MKYSSPTVTGALVKSVQVASGPKLEDDCNANPIAFVGQERTN